MNELKRPSTKRLLAWLLAIVLCVGAIPADAVFAEPEAASGTQAQSEDAQSEDGAQPQEAGLEDAVGESAQAEDGQTEYQVTFVFSAADGFSYLGEEGGQTVRTVAEDGFITDVQEAYSNGTRNIVGWQDAETGERVYLSQPVKRNMVLYPVLDKYQVWFNCMELDCSEMGDVPAGTPLEDLVPTLEAKEHYAFEYWYVWGSEDEAFIFDDITVDRDYHFYGKVSRDFTYRATFFLASDFAEYNGTGITEYADESAMLEKPVYENGNRKVIGWKEVGQEEEFDFSQPLTHDVHLYPIYDKYMLQFSYETVYAEAGKILTDVPKGEDREHQIFKGWECWDPESGDLKLFDFSTEPITQDQSFQAAYERDYAYMVDFAWASDFYDEFDFEAQYLKEGEKPEKPPVLDNGFRKIIGWTTTWGSREEYDFTQEVTGDLYLYPIYDKYRVIFRGDDLYKIVYVPAGEKLDDVPKEESYDEHYSFGGWSSYGYNEETEEWEDIKFNFANTPITQDYSFDAIWNRNFAYEVRIYYNSVSDFKDCFAADNVGGLVTLYLQEGEKLDPLPEYDNGNRKIIGWTMKKNGRALYDFDQEVTEDISLYPVTDKCRLKFGKETCYVEYNTVFPQEELEKIPDPAEEEHYVFEGWGVAGKKVFDFTQPIKKDYTFKAVWKPDFNYIVYFDFGSDFSDYLEKNQIESTLYIKSGEKDTVDEPPVYDNGKRKITGWKEWGSNQPFDFSATIDRDVDLYPIYDKCMVTFCDYQGIYDWDYFQYNVYVTPGETVTPPAEVKDPYYTFKGWMYYDEDDDEVNFDFHTPIMGDRYLEAGWEPNFYSIYFYNNLEKENVPYFHGEGRVLKGQKAAGIRQQVGDPVVKGHYFAGWYYDEECTKPFSENTVLTRSIVLYAKWGTNSDGSSVTPGNGNEAKVTSVTLSATSLVIPKGKSQALTVTTAPLKNAAVTWSSSDNSVATVNAGTVTAKKAGEATITATAAGGASASCKVTVAEVKLNASSAELKTKQSSTALKIESKYPKNDTVVSWNSSNPKVVKVDKKGKITAEKKTGTAVITVTMKSGATATCKVTVKKKAVKTKKLTMNVKKLTMKKGKSVSLSVMRDPITATEKIKWSSSNKKVATVTSNGKVKAKKKGKATITAKSSNGKKATCKITVK